MQQLPNVLTDVEGSYYNGRLRCRFTVERDLDIYYPELSFIASDYHLLVSHGFARDGGFDSKILGDCVFFLPSLNEL